MSKQRPAYEVKPYPLNRRVLVDTGRAQRRRNTIHALVEVDVTEARQIIRAHKEKSGESLSFTAFILACYGHAIDQNRYLNAYRNLWGQLLLFEEVDCTTMIEIDWGDRKFPLAHILRSINQRDVRSISEEIQAVKNDPNADPGYNQSWKYAPLFILPWFIRDLVYFFLFRSPKLIKKHTGTTISTAVGMFGSGGGWGIPPGTIYTTSVMLGGIAERPGVVNGEIAIREYLSLTLSFDHDVVDGAPAARFVSRLKTFIEDAYGLDEFR